MARQRFETTEMLELEHAARQTIIDKTGRRIDKLSDMLWGVDWVIYTDDKVSHFAEFKRRYNAKDAYPDIRLCAMKYSKLRKYAEDFQLRCSYFIVEFDDAFVAIEIGPQDNIPKHLVPFGRSSESARRIRGSALRCDPAKPLPIDKNQRYLNIVNESVYYPDYIRILIFNINGTGREK
jgi:hypothetical protein